MEQSSEPTNLAAEQHISNYVDTFPEFVSTPTKPIQIGSVLHTFLENIAPSNHRPFCVFPMEHVPLKQNNSNKKQPPNSKIPTVKRLIEMNKNPSKISKGGIPQKDIKKTITTDELKDELVLITPEKHVPSPEYVDQANKVVTPRRMVSNCSSTTSTNYRPSLIPVIIKSKNHMDERNETDKEKQRRTGYDPKKTLRKIPAERTPKRKSYSRENSIINNSRIPVPVRVSLGNEENAAANPSLSKPENLKMSKSEDIVNENPNSYSMTHASSADAQETMILYLGTMSFQDEAAKILSNCLNMVINGVVILPGRNEKQTMNDNPIFTNKTEIQPDMEQTLMKHKYEQSPSKYDKNINPMRESEITNNASPDVLSRISEPILIDLNEKHSYVDKSHEHIDESKRGEKKKHPYSYSMAYASLADTQYIQQFQLHNLDTMSFQDEAAKILSNCPNLVSNGVVILPGRNEKLNVKDSPISTKITEIEGTKGILPSVSEIILIDLNEKLSNVDKSQKQIEESKSKEKKNHPTSNSMTFVHASFADTQDVQQFQLHTLDTNDTISSCQCTRTGYDPKKTLRKIAAERTPKRKSYSRENSIVNNSRIPVRVSLGNEENTEANHSLSKLENLKMSKSDNIVNENHNSYSMTHASSADAQDTMTLYLGTMSFQDEAAKILCDCLDLVSNGVVILPGRNEKQTVKDSPISSKITEIEGTKGILPSVSEIIQIDLNEKHSIVDKSHEHIEESKSREKKKHPTSNSMTFLHTSFADTQDVQKFQLHNPDTNDTMSSCQCTRTGYDPKKTLRKIAAEKTPKRKSYSRENSIVNKSRIPVKASLGNEENAEENQHLSKPENLKMSKSVDIVNENPNSYSMSHASSGDAQDAQKFQLDNLDTMSFQDEAAKILSDCLNLAINGVVILPGHNEKQTVKDNPISTNKTEEIQPDMEQKLLKHKYEQSPSKHDKNINPTRESGITNNALPDVLPSVSETIQIDLNEKHSNVDKSHEHIEESKSREKKKHPALNTEHVTDSVNATCKMDQTFSLPEAQVLKFIKAKNRNSRNTQVPEESLQAGNNEIRMLKMSLAAREGFINDLHRNLKRGNRILLERYQKLFKDAALQEKHPSEEDAKAVLKSYSKFVFWMNDYYDTCMKDIHVYEKLHLFKGETKKCSKFYYDTTMTLEGKEMTGIFIPLINANKKCNTVCENMRQVHE